MDIKNPILKQIWSDRYKKEGETEVDENIDRVAKGCSMNDREEEMFNKTMKEGLFFPAGRTMSNVGIGKDLTLNNCFTAPMICDDLDDILDKVKLGGKTHQKGGGIGYDFSQLRPKGTPTSNDAIASGAVSFMDVFNAQTATILQGNRRGANMGVMSIYNMDIEEFINAKSYEAQKLNHFNISVMVDDDFMKSVENNENIFLHYPVYDDEGKLIKDPSKWKLSKEINARYLWDLIMKKAYDNGEPGILQYDNMNKDNTLWYIENIVCTNPCFTGDMKLLTADGYKTFEELDGKNVCIINMEGNISQSKIWSSGTKDVIELTLSNKNRIKCTHDHVFMLNNGLECEAKDTLGKKILPYYGKTNNSLDLFVKLGFLQGDGGLGRLNSQTHKGLEVNIGYKDDDILALFDLNKKENCRSYYINGYNEILYKYGFDGSPLPKRCFPITYTTWNVKQKLNFLKGCYSANGSIIKNYRISYKTTSKVFALQLQKALLEIGISSYITTNKSKKVKFSNGEYLCKESYDVNISKCKDAILFYQKIGFVQKYKTNELIDLIKTKSPKVISIKEIGKHKVYDFTEPLTHWGIVEGLVVHNCGEYLAGTVYGNDPITKKKLDSAQYGGACNLGSLFLHRMVKDPFTKKARIDYGKLKSTINTGVRFLDNIIDINKFPDKIYENYQKSFRTIGLGITGLADMLTMLNLKYNSNEAVGFVGELLNYIAKCAYVASIELAKEKGSFPLLDREKFIRSGFIQKHIKYDREWQGIADDIKKWGIRNGKIMSVAPTGTLSLTFGENCSSGLEPIFSLEYERKVKFGGQSDDDIQIVKMRDYAYEKWLDVKNDENCIVKDDVFVTAMNMSVDAHVNMLAAIAFHVDMSCSKTINIPTEYSFEDTKKVYMDCWKMGIKGCTIFRPNEIRQGILISDGDKKKDDVNPTLKRGEWKQKASDTIYYQKKIYIGCGKLSLFIGWSDSEKSIQDLYIQRTGKGGCEKNIQSTVIAMSGMLRLGGNIFNIEKAFDGLGACNSFISNRLKGEKLSRGNSCGTAILNAIKEFLKEMGEGTEGTHALLEKKEDVKKLTHDDLEYIKKNGEIDFAKRTSKCPICGEKLLHAGGCIQCESCGWSKCE